MDRRLLALYNRELQHLRETAAEFAEEFPKVAGRLGMSGLECADPYVERLLEGVAFLGARVQLKLDAEFPRFTNSLLDTIYPHYLCPTPSMAVVKIQPDLREGDLAKGFGLPKGTVLRSMLGKGDKTACEYRTSHDLKLWPLQLTKAQYYTREVAAIGLADTYDAKAGFHFQLKCTAGLTFDKTGFDTLRLYLRGQGDLPMRIYEQMLAHAKRIVVQPTSRPVKWHSVVGPENVKRVGYNVEHAMIPYAARSFQGYRLLHEYFAFPQRYMFIDIAGLGDAAARHKGDELDVIVLLDEVDLDLEGNVDLENFELFCTPAINLFPKRCDRIHVTDKFSEFHVVPDRTRPLDFEVYQVNAVTGFGLRGDDEQAFDPFYEANDFDSESRGAAYFTVNRVPRAMTDRERRRGKRSSYAGSEAFISLVDAHNAPFRADLRQLAIEALCTNRDLPLHMAVGQGPTDFSLETGAPVENVRCVAGPTAPKPSHGEGDTSWRLVSHLSLNYLSLQDTEGGAGVEALKDLLRLYGTGSSAEIRKQIDGLKSISVQPIIRRVQTPGPIGFARGLEVTVTFEDAAFEGMGIFLLGSVLEQFFAKYVSMNSFTETVIRSMDRGEVMRWPARLGQRHIV